MENFTLDDDENFEKTCGEIILTTKGRLAFYCTLCGEYKSYKTFVIHLLERCGNFLEDDLKECITKNSLLNSMGSFLSFREKKTSPVLKPNENFTSKQIQRETVVPEQINLDLQENFMVEDLQNSTLTPKTEYLENLEETISSVPEQSLSSYIEIDPKIDTFNDSENEEFDIESGEIEYYDESYEELINVEHMEVENVIAHENEHENRDTEDEHGSRDHEDEHEITHTQYKPKLDNNNRQPEQNKRNQEQLSATRNIKKRKGPIDIDITGVVRDVCKRNRYKPSKVLDEERKYKCPVCDFAFKDIYNMRHHLRRHTDQKNHSCPQCNKRFFSSTEVRTHLKSHGNVEKTFLCPECGLGFHTNYRLLCHQKRHRNQKDYICEICKKGFFNLSTLKTHMACHSSDRPFSCEICGATFKRRNGAREHRKQHENKRKYKCKICDAAFNVHAGLYSHMKSKHKDMATFNE